MDDAVKVDIPVKWYLHQLLELSQSEKPFYSYSELYERCKAEGSVTNVGEFHAMVTYFHALGLLIHLCGADVGHTEESACLVFTDPSHLFENISKLYLVQFVDIRGGDKVLLKHEGKLTKDALRELGVQLSPDHFMDLLVQLFIGAEIKSQEVGRILFVPSVLTSSPDDAAPSGVSAGPQEDSLGFAVTFENTFFIPCGVFTGMSARLQNAEEWEIFTTSITRKRMTFSVGTEGTVTLFDHATHISVNMDHHEGQYREYRDTVVEAVADSYCFLFHGTSAENPRSRPCSECVKSPYLVLGQTCQECHTSCDTPAAPHFAELKLKSHVATTVRCRRTTIAKKLSESECDLFQNMSHYAVIERQHTGCTLERTGSGGIPPSQTGSETPSSAHPPIGTCQTAPTSKKAQATSTAGQPLEERVLMECQTRFFKVVAVKEIYRELCQKHVIPQTVADKITNSHGVQDARGHLFDHMRDYGTLATLKVFCDVITSENYDGFQAMQDFGSEMRRRLEQEAPHPPSSPSASSSSSMGGCTSLLSPMDTDTEVSPFLVHMVLEKYEEDFFKCVNAKLWLRKLIRRGMITGIIKGDIESANDDEAREILFDHLKQNANVDTLKKYLKVAIAADGDPKMQSLGRKLMEELEQGGEAPMTRCWVHGKHLGLRGDSGYGGLSRASTDLGYKGSSTAATSTGSPSHLVERYQKMSMQPHAEGPSLSYTELSSEDIEEKSKHQGSKVPLDPAGKDTGLPREPDSAAVKGAEAAMFDLCWIPFDIQSQSVGPEGGKLCLEPSAGDMGGGEGGTILLEVPPGAVSPAESVEVRSALIPNGPFTLPEGYQLGSMVVYLYYDGRHLTKPCTLSLPHWYGGEDQVRDGLSFAMAPHTLKEGESVYHFELLEGGRFAEQWQCGVLRISGHCTLFAEVFKVKASSLYYASLWAHQVQGAVIAKNVWHSKVVITYANLQWIEVLKECWEDWKRDPVDQPVQFMFSGKKVQGMLSVQRGEGWEASLKGTGMVHSEEVAYHGRYNCKDLESAVKEHIYPPAIQYVVMYQSPPDCSRGVKMNKLSIKGIEGAETGQMEFPFEVYKVKSSETPSSAHPPIGTCQTAPTSKKAQTTSTVALPTSPAFPGTPHPTPVRDPGVARPFPTATPPQPDTADIIEALNNQLNARWRLFGIFLRVDYQTIDAIRLDNGGRPDDCMLDLLGRWTSNQAGTGTLPRNWQTVVEAVKKTGFPVIAENLAENHGVTLSQ